MTLEQNREAWLINAAKAMAPWFAEIDEEVPPIRVSVGWPGGRGRKNAVGQCWASHAASDNVAQIFVTPARGEESTVDVLGTLLHEMVHAVDDCSSGHRGNFIKIARQLGFKAKWTTSACRTDELAERLKGLAERLGPFPSAAIVGGKAADTPKTQTTRMLKVACPKDGYTVRTTRKWLDDLGAPTCPCGTRMEEVTA